MARAPNAVPSGNTRVAMYLANCVEQAVVLSYGVLPAEGPEDGALPVVRDIEDVVHYTAVGLAAKVHGARNVALYLFAKIFPEHAARLDRASLDKMVTAYLAGRQSGGRGAAGGRWPAVIEVCRLRLGLHVKQASVEAELKAARRPARPK
jgi:hypothetical protein